MDTRPQSISSSHKTISSPQVSYSLLTLTAAMSRSTLPAARSAGAKRDSEVFRAKLLPYLTSPPPPSFSQLRCAHERDAPPGQPWPREHRGHEYSWTRISQARCDAHNHGDTFPVRRAFNLGSKLNMKYKYAHDLPRRLNTDGMLVPKHEGIVEGLHFMGTSPTSARSVMPCGSSWTRTTSASPYTSSSLRRTSPRPPPWTSSTPSANAKASWTTWTSLSHIYVN